MKTTKTVAAFLIIVALILGGCSTDQTNSVGKSTATRMSGSGTLVTTMTTSDNTTGNTAGNTTGTPGALGTLDANTTPSAGTTLGTATNPTMDANTTGTPAAVGTLSTTGTPAAVGTMATTGTTTAQATMATTQTAGTTTAPIATSTVDAMTTPVATATVAMATPLATATVAMATPLATATVAMATPVATGTADANTTPTPVATPVIPAVGGSTGTGELVTLQANFEQIYNQVNPSVVYIEVVLGSAASGTGNANSGPARASGSGFVWDAQGHIVTNNHVIDGATTVNVTFMDGTTAVATVVGQDPNADLAVLQVTVPATQLHPVTMGDSTKVRVGQIAIAIGNPFGLAGSMSEGIISALARSLPVQSSNQNQQGNSPTGVYNIPSIIQTDAAINPGNSGGVLVNLQGEVIGVTAAIASQSQSNSGIGFVIPSAIVTKVVPDLITNGKFAHPWLGVTGMTLSSDLTSKMKLPATQRGAMIVAVTPSGPAATAGLLPSTVDNSTGNITTVGDVITAINGQPVRVFEDLGSYLFLNTKPGDVVTLTVLRDGKEQTIKVTLGTLPTP